MRYEKIGNAGMTLPELTLAVLMLAAFAGITVMVTQYTSRFFQPINQKGMEANSSNKELSDLLNENSQINNAFDSIIEIFLSQV